MDGSIAPSNSEIQRQRFARPERAASQNSKQLQASLFDQILSLRTPVTIPATPAAELPRVASDSQSPNTQSPNTQSPKTGEYAHRASRPKEAKYNDSKPSDDDETTRDLNEEAASLVVPNSPLIAGEIDEPETVASGVSIDLPEANTKPQTTIPAESQTGAAADSSVGEEPKEPRVELADANQHLQSDAARTELANESLTPATDGLENRQVQATPELELPEQPTVQAPLEVDSQTTLAAPVEAPIAEEVFVAGTHDSQPAGEVDSRLSVAESTVQAPVEASTEALQPNDATELTATTKLPADVTEPVAATAKEQVPNHAVERVTTDLEFQDETPSEPQLTNQSKPVLEGLQNQKEISPQVPHELQPEKQVDSSLEHQDAAELAPPVERQENARRKWYESSASLQRRSEREPQDQPRGVVGSADGLAASHSEQGFQARTASETPNPSSSVVNDPSLTNDLWTNASTTVHNIVADPLATGVSAGTLIAEVGSTANDLSHVGVDVQSSTSPSRRAGVAREPNATPLVKSNDITQQEQARLIQRISRSFSRLSPTGGQINLRLHPPQLGALNMQVRLEGRTMTAKLTAETTAARDAILESLPILKGRLAEQGFDVSQFQVEVADNNANAAFSSKQGQDNLGQQGRENPKPHVDYRRVALADSSARQAGLESNAPISLANWGSSRGIDIHA